MGNYLCLKALVDGNITGSFTCRMENRKIDGSGAKWTVSSPLQHSWQNSDERGWRLLVVRLREVGGFEREWIRNLN